MDLWVVIIVPALRYALQIAGNLGQAVLQEKSQWMPTMLLGSAACGMHFCCAHGTVGNFGDLELDMPHIKYTNPKDRKVNHHYFSRDLLVIVWRKLISLGHLQGRALAVNRIADVAVLQHSGLMRWATSCHQHCPE